MGTRLNRIMVMFLSLLITVSGYSHTFRMNNARTGTSNMAVYLPLKKENSVQVNAPIISSPTLMDEIIYVGARDSCIYALSEEGVLWKRKTNHWVDASPTYKDGRIYAASRDGYVYILDAATGDSLGMIFNGSTQCSSPLIHDSLIIFGCGGWAQDIKASSINSTNYCWHYTNRQPVYSSAALKDSIICYGENGGALTALNVNTGELIWKYQTGGGFYLSTPAISDNIVWVSPGTWDSHVYAISLTGGTLLWKAANSIMTMAQPVDRNFVKKLLRYKPKTRKKMLEGYRKYYRMRDSQMNALEHLTEEKRASSEFTSYGGNASSSVAVGKSNVFVAHMEHGHPKPRFSLSAFDKGSGTEKWTFSEMRSCVNLGICSSPVVAGSIVFCGWGEGKFYAFHADNGTKLWEDSLGGDILSSPYIENGKILVATTTGEVATYVQNISSVNFATSTYCYPNPARAGITNIHVYVEKKATLKMTVYNSSEKPVFCVSRTLAAEEEYIYNWNLKDVANGIYFANIEIKYSDGGEDKKILKIAVLN